MSQKIKTSVEIDGSLTASQIIKSGGTSAQFLKANGSVDSNAYYLASNPSGYISTYAETDTLASVTSRGSSTSTAITLLNSLTLAGFGSNSFINGTGDGSSFATYNFALSGWSSMAFYNPTSGGAFPNQVSGLIDFRAGTINMKGGFSVNGSTVLHAGNFNNYSPTLLGVGASGTWGINVTGYSTQLNGYTNQSEATILTGPANGPVWRVRYDSNTANRYVDFGFKDGNGVFSTGLKIYNGDTPTWQGNTLLHAGNYSSYAVPLTRTITINGVTQDLSSNRSFTVTATETDTLATVVARGDTTNGGRPIRLDTSGGGVYIKGSGGGWATGYYFTGSSNTYRGGFGALGDSDSLSNYWIGPAYNNFYTYIDASQITHTSSMRSPIFYDSNNTGYYIDPSNSSNINIITANEYYSGGWFRNNTNNTGLYNQVNGNHFYSRGGSNWGITGNGAGSGISLDFYGNHQTTYRGSVHADTNSSIGFLTDNGGWGLRITTNKNAYFHGNTIYIGADGQSSSNIIMQDGDEGDRQIHCNSNRVGFLTQAGSWGSYCTDNGDWTTDMISYAGASMRAPIFYDSNDTGYYFDGTGGTRQSRYLTISGGGSGNNGNELVVGSTTVQYSLQDTNLRPIIQATGAYPVLTLNHTITSNGSHGATVQFTSNGVGNQFVIGSSGNGSRLDIGTSSNTNWNPHNGIDNYQGTTGLRMDTFGNIFNLVSTRSPIYYDDNNTGYYVDPASTSYLNAVDARSYITSGNPWGTANSAWFPNGITTPNVTSWLYGNVFLGNAPGNGAGTEATASGQIISTGDHRASIFYEYSNTGYYLDPAGTSNLVNIGLNGYINFNGSGTSVRISESYGILMNCVSTPWNVQMINTSLLVGLSASGGNYGIGNGYFTGDVTAFYSDRRLKHNLVLIDNAVEKVKSLNGYTYQHNELGQELLNENAYKLHAGLIAQEVQAVLPEVVTIAPFDLDGHDEQGNGISKSGENYLTIKYERIVPLLIEAIKEQQTQIEGLKELVNKLINK